MKNRKEIIGKIKQEKKLAIVLAVGLLGILLLAFGSFSESSTDRKQKAQPADEQQEQTYTTADIEALLEQRLESIAGQVRGAGSVSAMVTVSSSGEYVFAENKKTETDSDSSSEDKEIVLYESSGGADAGLVVSIRSPDILGVAILCEGGGSSVVRAEITKLVTSLFGIGSDRVYVGEKA